MRIPRIIISISFCLLLPVCVSCSKIESPPSSAQTLSEADQRFLKICQEETELNPITKSYPHTLWIYLPTDKRLIDYKSTKDGPTKSKNFSEKLTINYLDAYFSENTFFIEYDIRKTINYPMSYGYTSIYTDDYQDIQNQILTSLHRAYSGLGLDTENNADAPTERPPNFVVLTVSDVKTGLEIVSLFNYEDFKRAMTDPNSMPQDEFAKRNISELKGHDSIIEDTSGQHIEYKDIQWPEFLAKQILQRVRFKYQHSDFKPGEDAEEEIMTIVSETIQAYHFANFQAVKLYNLQTNTPFKFDRSQLATFGSLSNPYQNLPGL